MASARLVLKVYSLILGGAVSFLAFLWIVFELYVVSQTNPDQTDLLMARYLDISFGLLAFSSALALMYGAFVESKTWISVWTLGSATVLVGCWVWLFYRKYFNDHPESLVEAQNVGVIVTLIYLCTSFPVWCFYRCYLEPSSFFVKPWCMSEGNNTNRGTPSSGNTTFFTLLPNSLCSLSQMARFTSSEASPRPPARQYVIVPDGSNRSNRSKEEDLYNPV